MHPLITKAFQSKGFNISDLKPSGNIVTHTPTSKKYLTRIASGQALPQMKGEAAGLRAMGLTSKNLAPELIGFEVENGEGGIVSEYWDLGGKGGGDYQRELARKIAQMHSPPHQEGIDEAEGVEYTGKYGFGVPTHCGISQLDNTWEDSWEVFYRDRRLADVIKKINDSDVNHEWEKMKNKYVHIERGELRLGQSHYYFVISRQRPNRSSVMEISGLVMQA
jgi:protein-ribulosamine 3-kinase